MKTWRWRVLAMVVIPTAMLIGLALEAIRNERLSARERLRLQCEEATRECSSSLQRKLFEEARAFEGRVAGPHASAGALEAALLKGGITDGWIRSWMAVSRDGRWWLPRGMAASNVNSDGWREITRKPEWREAERLEFSTKEYPRAADAFHALGNQTADPRSKAIILRNEMVCWWKAGQADRVAGTAEELRDSFGREVDDQGIPLDVVGYYFHLRALSSTGKTREFERLAGEVKRAASAGTWVFSNQAFAEAWAKRFEGLGLREIAETFREGWSARVIRDGRLVTLAKNPGWTAIHFGGESLLVHRVEGKAAQVPMSVMGLVRESAWKAEMDRVAPLLFSRFGEGCGAVVKNTEGRIFWGQEGPGAVVARQSLAAPLDFLTVSWTVPPGGKALEAISRRRLAWLVGVLVAAVGALGLGGWMSWRGLSREMEILRLKGNMVASVSHEMRTPLAAIRLFGELLSTGRAAGEKKKQEYYQLIMKEGERLSRLVENALLFSRIDAGRQQYSLTPGDVGELTASVVERFRAYVEADRVEIRWTPPAERLVARLDEESATCALFNLLDNAVKYSGSRGTVRVAVSKEKGGVRVAVRDEGIGIAPEEQEKIFDRFYRVGHELTREYRGTGLGLALVKDIMRVHGGTVTVESALGAGSTFILSFPSTEVA